MPPLYGEILFRKRNRNLKLTDKMRYKMIAGYNGCVRLVPFSEQAPEVSNWDTSPNLMEAKYGRG